jgi:heavy metal translocating P-type ATPase
MILELIYIGALVIGYKKVKKKFFPPEKVKEASPGTKIMAAQQKALIPVNKGNKLPMETKRNLDIVISGSSFGFALGGLLFPPLTILSIPGMVYTSLPVFKKAFALLKSKKRVGVESLLAITALGCVAFGYWVAGSLAVFTFALAQKLLGKVTRDSKEKLIDIFQLTPNEVWLVVDKTEIAVSINDVKTGDLIAVHAGGIIPVDGVIVDGIASIDQHILTGEGTPVEKEQGQEVFASTVVLSGRIVVEVKYAGKETTLAKIARILNQSIEFKSTVELRAHNLADRTVKPALILGAASLPFLGTEGALAVINSHFKYKMQFITPISIINFFNLASRKGIIIKDGRSLELLNKVDTIVFDKTGTLTEEQPTVGAIHTCAGHDKMQVLRYTATAEYKQTHPIARAVLKEAKIQKLDLPVIDEVNYQVGYGLTVTIADHLIQVGSHRFMKMLEIEIPPVIREIQDDCFLKGHSLLMIAEDKKLIGAIELIPTIRPEAKELIRILKARPQITASYIISGDNETPTRFIAEELGIDHYFAETLPVDKAKIIEQLRDEGKFICYVGDGINDAIALKKAHVSVSLCGASMVATDTAQIVLMEQGLSYLNFVFDLAKDFEKNMNTIFSTVTIPALISVGGVLFLGLGIGSTIILNLVGLSGGVVGAMIPLIKNKTGTKKDELQGVFQDENKQRFTA